MKRIDKIRHPSNLLAMAVAALMTIPGQAWADHAPEAELISMSLEDLLNIEVTSIMKSATRLSDAPAAIFVLTNDDIRRTGATSVPEALRVVPGLHVARIDANKWAVTARGFNGQFATKLLVLVDGRSVYTPLFSGVWWDNQDVMMEDIERIEVIRGPGASLWGANAVNGVINIITRNARDTQGTLVSAHAGNERSGGGVRHGAKVGEDAYLKVYGRYASHDDSPARGGDQESIDHAHLSKLGFRYDKNLSSRDKLMFQGEAFSGYSGGAPLPIPNLSAKLTPVLTPPYNSERPTAQESSGHHLLGAWERALENNSALRLQLYWDRHERTPTEFNVSQRVDTFDIDFQHSFKLSDLQHVIWGLGYRRNHSETNGSFVLDMYPLQLSENIHSAFVQDEITLVPERWKLTLGTKIENHPGSGNEFQPNARLLWTPDEKNSLWASASRAVRTPNWVERNVGYSAMTLPPGTPENPSPFPVLITSSGNPEVKSEKMLAYELGWRGLLTPALSADAALFYFDYRDASSNSPGGAQPMGPFTSIPFPPFALPSYVLQPVNFTNYAQARTYGGELAMNWQATDNWKLRANYSYFESHFSLDNSATANTSIPFDHSYPRHQAMLWSMHQLAPKVQLDLNLRYVGKLNIQQAPGEYVALDARIGWKPQKNMELALVGHNLLDSGHVEYGLDQWSVPTQNPREVYATVRLDF